MKLFHQRNRRLVLLAALGGIYLPCVERIIPFRPIQAILKGYAAVLVSSLFFCGLMAVRHTVFLANNLIVRIMAANNVCNDFLCCGRALYFNLHRDKTQTLYDQWDAYFTGDRHEEKRQLLLKQLKKPNKKYIMGSAGLIQFMLVSWAMEQFGHEDCQFSVPVGLPFNNQNPEYLIWATFIFVVFSLFGPMLLSTDAMIMEPMTWISAEFVRLREDLAEILGSIKVNRDGQIMRCKDGLEQPYTSIEDINADFAHVEGKLKEWITEHQKLLLFYKQMKEVNHLPVSIQLLSTTITICFLSFIVATNLLNPFDTFIGLLFFVPNYILFYITSTYGNLINEHAADVFLSGFSTNWSIYPKHVQKLLHIIAMRTNYSAKIMIMGLFPLGSKTYFQIVQTAYSFYSFLRFLTSKQSP